MVHYCLPEFSDVGDFLALLAKRRGMLRKGGRPDVNKAAKLVLQDWNMSVAPGFFVHHYRFVSNAKSWENLGDGQFQKFTSI